jgi:hypothetical protein
MTKIELMESIYNRDPARCSAGDLVFALARRFPKLAKGDDRWTLANDFLKKKREEYFAKKREEQKRKEEIREAWYEFRGACFEFARELSHALKREGEKYDFSALNKREEINTVGNAFAKLGI